MDYPTNWRRVYKCRLCGQRMYDDKLFIEYPPKRRSHKQVLSPTDFKLHECFGGDVGIADALGLEVVDD